ncbi:hypothetical protein [Flavilitoribacter nigricans]|nr:hypothetical protein [Flavilitoribacter nigricans]
METKLNSRALAIFKSFEIKNPEKIKGGDGDDTGENGLIGSDEIGEV